MQDLTNLAKEIKLLELAHSFAAVALHVPGVSNRLADALSRLNALSSGLDPYLDGRLRGRIWRQVAPLLQKTVPEIYLEILVQVYLVLLSARPGTESALLNDCCCRS